MSQSPPTRLPSAKLNPRRWGGYCQVDEKLVDRPPRYWARANREPAILGIKNGRRPQLDNTRTDDRRPWPETFAVLAGGMRTVARTLSQRLGGQKPVAPDLWLLANGEHRFIEVKLPGDCLRAPQYAGLALLAAHLPSARPIAVSVVTLESSEDQFAKFTRILRR